MIVQKAAILTRYKFLYPWMCIKYPYNLLNVLRRIISFKGKIKCIIQDPKNYVTCICYTNVEYMITGYISCNIWICHNLTSYIHHALYLLSP